MRVFVSVGLLSVGAGLAVLVLWLTGTAWPSSVSSGITAAAAEAYTIDYVRFEEKSAEAWISDDWQPTCEAKDRAQEGWLVRCGMEHPDGSRLPPITTYLVEDDGRVSAFPP